MSDTPDFDKMTPDEIMKWMESLAKRQGATEGFTTAADMQVAEVSADDERAKNVGEYVPFGWKAEDWKKHLEKEEAEKKRKAAAAQPVAAIPVPVTPPPAAAAPPPAPAPQPVAAQAAAPAANDTPDFDKMSPDEIMKWMESLAKRQGATEGFTTAADMQVAEVAADDERAQNVGEYVPFEWRNKPDEWRKKEAEEKEKRAAAAAKAPAPAPVAARPAAPVTPPPAAVQPPAASVTPPTPVKQPAAEFQPPPSLDDFFSSGGLPILDNDDEDETVAATSANPMDWLSGLTGESDEGIEALAGNEMDDPFAALEALASGKDDVPDSMDWLAGLSTPEDNGLDALSNLAGLSQDDDPLSMLGNLAAESDTPVNSKPVGPAEGVDPMDWMNALARRQGASTEELTSDAEIELPQPATLSTDGPGYTPYSFEGEIDGSTEEPVVEANDLSWLMGSDDDEDALELESESPENWLDDLASGVSTEPKAATPAPVAAVPAAPEVEEAEEAIDPDEVMRKLSSAKEVSPEDIDKMFGAFFDRAEQYADRDEDFDIPEESPSGAIEAEIPDWLSEAMGAPAAPPTPPPAATVEDMADVLDGLDDEPIQAQAEAAPSAEIDMPDWLNGMSETVEAGTQADEAVVDMPDWLNDVGAESPSFDEPAGGAVAVDIPEWLQSDTPDTGDIKNDIFDTPAEASPGSTTTTIRPGIVIDTTDPWVNALTEETEHADDLARWYAEKTGTPGEATPTPAAAAPAPAPVAKVQAVTPPPAAAMPAAGVLKSVELPVEAELQAGEPEAVPDWLTGDVVVEDFAGAEVDAEAMPDWLNPDAEAVSDMPDWLQAGVDDSVTAGNTDMPNWLETVESGDEDIPDWLIDTMQGDDQPAVSVDAFTFDAEPAPMVDEVIAPAPPPAPVKKSPAPVAAVVASINVTQTLQSARGKVSGQDIDGALQEYESIVRANAGLDEVISDLSRLSEDKSHKKNPAIFRVLGDGLMRRGNLQQALDTYRKALNLL